MNIERIKIGQRYVGHVEDDPIVWQKSSDDIDEMIAHTEAMVRDRNIANGAGEGVVIDTLSNRIVACFGMDMPSDEIEEARVVEVVKLSLQSHMMETEIL